MIRVDNLSKHYGSRLAVDHISFEVNEGEIVGFLGPNGAGKSTTLRMITGFLAPSEGAVRVGGVDALKAPQEAQALIGYMPEGVPLYPELRVREYLRFRAELKGVPRRKLKERVEASLELASVADAADRIIGQLSKGYRQRVGLADALLADPPILILDEPSSGLDPNQNRQMRELIKGFRGKKTVLLSTHILPEVETVCSNVVIINRGRLVTQGETASLLGARDGQRHIDVELRVPDGLFDRPKDRVVALLQEACADAEVSLLSDAAERGAFSFRIKTTGDATACEAIASRLVGAGVGLRGLTTERASLEDVFSQLTTEDHADVADVSVSAPDGAVSESRQVGQDEQENRGGSGS